MNFSLSRRLKFLFAAFIFFQTFSAFAQTKPDSIPQGVISVQRPPIPAAYRTQISYIYSESSRRNRSVEFSGNLLVFRDSVFDPSAPQPLRYFNGSSNGAVGDSAVIRELSSERPSEDFNWENYLESMHYAFAWTDTSRIDSAKFEFTIDKKGNTKCKPIYWVKADSTCRSFEKKSVPYMMRLWQWYPARKIKSDKRKREDQPPKYKKVASKVIVTIYAYDPNEERLLPIESQIIPK